jgi:glycolate dehydrogenase FAD-binding subunit
LNESLAPTDERGVAAAVSEAAKAQEPLSIIGRGTKAGMLRPVQAARSLTTRNLTGITLYAPNELVISARTGTPLREIAATLTERGQHIIAEPPDLAGISDYHEWQTLGGVVATNLSGPRRIAWGAMRDHVLGIRAVTGRGEVIHSGGRVLKNVTGLDLCKLFTGSHGTLGVITEVTLKVLPAPQAVGTVVVPGMDASGGVATLSAALGSPYSVSAAAWLPAEAAARIPQLEGFGRPLALARIEEFAASVAYRTGKLRTHLGQREAEILDDPSSRAVWQAIRDLTPLRTEADDAIWRISVRPSEGAVMLTRLGAAFGARGYLDWGGGLVWVAGPASTAAHLEVEAATERAGGTWMLMRAPQSLRAAVDVIPREPAPLARITRRVKAAFDPHGILNPGRMYAGL